MGLTDNQKKLIREIAEKNIVEARKCALACLEEDNTSKNKFFCDKYKSILKTETPTLIEIPYQVKSFLYMEDVKQTFKSQRYLLTKREEKILEQIIRMKKVGSRMKEMGISYINSTILFGKSGTGKTTFGRYVAFKTGLPFCYVKLSNLLDSYLGGTPKNIGKIFEFIRSMPCVFMLDEIDSISVRRSEVSGEGCAAEMARVTISLMQEIDSLPSDVILLAATNRIDRMDEALIRRFVTKHEVEDMTYLEALAFLNMFAEDVKIPFKKEEFEEIIAEGTNQAKLSYRITQKIAEKIEKELEENA